MGVAFGDPDDFGEKGGLKAMGESLRRGHVLVMSMWDDHDANMLWLDSDYPLDKDPSIPGVNRGPCPTDSGDPVTWSQTTLMPLLITTMSNGDQSAPHIRHNLVDLNL